MSKVYSNIFLLKDIICLSSLTNIFNRKHQELLSYVKKDEKQVSNMSTSEKYFIYSWKEIGEVEEMKIPKLNSENENILHFQRAIANVEYTKRKKKDENGNFLPKDQRLNDSDIDILFFEKEKKVYVLILTSNEYNIQRVKKLIGSINISVENPEYTLESDIFNWLFYVYTDMEGNINEDITLENISGFIGNVTDDANVFTGTSYHTTELIVTKAFISNGGELKNITLRVRDSDVDLTCMVNDCSTVVLNCNFSEKLRILDSLDKPTFLLLYLYSYLIIKLKQLYDKESNKFIHEDNPKFSKRIGVEVIQSIVEKNNIQFEDLKYLLGAEAHI